MRMVYKSRIGSLLVLATMKQVGQATNGEETKQCATEGKYPKADDRNLKKDCDQEVQTDPEWVNFPE